jgi:hypothetical protein
MSVLTEIPYFYEIAGKKRGHRVAERTHVIGMVPVAIQDLGDAEIVAEISGTFRHDTYVSGQGALWMNRGVTGNTPGFTPGWASKRWMEPVGSPANSVTMFLEQWAAARILGNTTTASPFAVPETNVHTGGRLGHWISTEEAETWKIASSNRDQAEAAAVASARSDAIFANGLLHTRSSGPCWLYDSRPGRQAGQISACREAYSFDLHAMIRTFRPDQVENLIAFDAIRGGQRQAPEKAGKIIIHNEDAFTECALVPSEEILRLAVAHLVDVYGRKPASTLSLEDFVNYQSLSKMRWPQGGHLMGADKENYLAAAREMILKMNRAHPIIQHAFIRLEVDAEIADHATATRASAEGCTL